MEKYELDGETYYFTGSNWIDSHYTLDKKSELYKLNKLRSSNIFLEDKSFEELLVKADQIKNTDDYILAIKIFERMLQLTTDPLQMRKILPRYTSMLRKDNKSNKAIEIYKEYYEEYKKTILSPALLTSVAAAYCDVSNIEDAKKLANYAYSMSGGNSSSELISVYARIKKLEK